MDDFLQQYSRCRHSIIGDGNCLFRSFSFILFQKESKHFDIRKLLVQFITLNPSHFQSYCFPLIVKAHTDKMKDNHVWGTHVEIFAFSLYFVIPVFVAMDKGINKYYWAKYCKSPTQDANLVFPADSRITFPTDISHIEICHVNNNHYDVVINADGSIPKTPPYSGTASSSLAMDSIIIT